MKKGWKIFMIVCGSVAALGVIMCVISFALGFRLSDMPRYTGSIGWFGHSDNDDDRNSSANVKLDGDGKEYSGIRELDVDVTQVKVEIEKYDGTAIKVEHANIDNRLKLNIYQEEETLVVETVSKLRVLSHTNGIIKIYVPRDLAFTEADLSIGAGELVMNNISSTSLDIEVGAGSATISDFVTDELSVSCGAGEIILSGETKQDADLECSVGSISYQVLGKEQDYNYDVECGIGSVQIGGRSFEGIAAGGNLNNEAAKEMSVNCGVGEVIISFEEN